MESAVGNTSLFFICICAAMFDYIQFDALSCLFIFYLIDSLETRLRQKSCAKILVENTWKAMWKSETEYRSKTAK